MAGQPGTGVVRRSLLGDPSTPTTDVMRWARVWSGWSGLDLRGRMNAMKEAVLNAAGTGDMYVALLADPVVETIVDDDGELLPIPAGYTRVGRCGHVPDLMGRFMATVEPPMVGYRDGIYPLGRVLVLTTVVDAAGPVHVASVMPRVRANGYDPEAVEVFAYHDDTVRYTWKVLYGGPGWQRLAIEAGR